MPKPFPLGSATPSISWALSTFSPSNRIGFFILPSLVEMESHSNPLCSHGPNPRKKKEELALKIQSGEMNLTEYKYITGKITQTLE